MGATQCGKCSCNDASAESSAPAPTSDSPYHDRIESGSLKSFPLEPKDESRPLEETGVDQGVVAAEPVLPPKVSVPKDSDADFMNLVLKFNLQDGGKSFQAQFTEVRGDNPGDQGLLVVTEVGESSPLANTIDNFTGICAGDSVLEVNGAGGTPKALLEGLTKAKAKGGELKIKVKPRPATFLVELQRKAPGDKMGIVAAVHDDTEGRVEVRTVVPQGSVHAWNENNYPLQVLSGDWITSVGKKQMASNEMITCMQDTWVSEQKLYMEILSMPTLEQRRRGKK